LSMADISDLAARLQDHKDQLAQIDQLLAAAPGDEELLKIKEDLEQVVALTEELTGGGGGAGGDAAQGGGAGKWKVGDRCTAKWEDNKYYSAIITDVQEDDYSIRFLDYGNTGTCTEASLKTYVPLALDQLVAGAQVRAIWAEDGLFYDAHIVNDLGNDRYELRFPKFGKKKFIVGAYDMNPRFGKKTASVNTKEPVPEDFTIPENLRCKPTDTDAQRRSKRARVKKLKFSHKKSKIEQEGSRKQNNWLAFQKTAKTSFGKKRKSMFATDATGTVGVIGSGKGMTSNPDLIRNKYNDDYSDGEED